MVRGAWQQGCSEPSSRAGPDPEASAEILFGLPEALWWLGAIRESLDCLERAYLGFRQRTDPAQAAFTAIQLSLLYNANVGNHAAASGWLARAARLVDEHELAPLRGWVLITEAVMCADPARHEALARAAYEVARAFRRPRLELSVLMQIGVTLIDQGRITEGMAFHDEAMARARR